MDRASSRIRARGARGPRHGSVGVGLDLAAAGRCAPSLFARPRCVRGRAASRCRRRRVEWRAGACSGHGNGVVRRCRPRLRPHRDDPGRRVRRLPHPSRRALGCERGDCRRRRHRRDGRAERRDRVADPLRAPRDQGVSCGRRVCRPGDAPATAGGSSTARGRSARRRSRPRVDAGRRFCPSAGRRFRSAAGARRRRKPVHLAPGRRSGRRGRRSGRLAAHSRGCAGGGNDWRRSGREPGRRRREARHVGAGCGGTCSLSTSPRRPPGHGDGAACGGVQPRRCRCAGGPGLGCRPGRRPLVGGSGPASPSSRRTELITERGVSAGPSARG